MLSASELSRYSRQILLPEMGIAGQERLRSARVLVVGAGGLGSPAAIYLAAAGVGTLGLLDSDQVELSNLHRQILHGADDVDRNKTASAAESVARLNPHVVVREHTERLTAQTAARVFEHYDLIVDGSDNYPTRYAVNDACVRLDLPWVYASVERFSGQLSLFPGAQGPCYRCLYSEAPQPGTTASCDEIGVLGVLPGIMGALQASEAIKWLLDIGDPLAGKLVTFDLRTVHMRTVAYDRNPSCTACGASGPSARRPSIEEGSVQLEPQTVAALIDRGADVLLLDVREPWEHQIARIGNSQLVPMNELPRQLGSIDRTRDIVVYCHHGMRSDMAAEWLRSQGFPARNLAGGIDRWSREVDPAIPRY